MKRASLFIASLALAFGPAAAQPQPSKGGNPPPKSQGEKQGPPPKKSDGDGGKSGGDAGAAPKPSSGGQGVQPKPSSGPSPGTPKPSGGQDVQPKPSIGPTPGTPQPSSGGAIGVAPKPRIGANGGVSGPTILPHRSSQNSEPYISSGESYLRGKPKGEIYLRRQNRALEGPVYQPRTSSAAKPLLTSNNLGRPTPQMRHAPPSVPKPTARPAPGGRGSFQHQVRTMEEYPTGDLRRGYYHYDSGWRDCHFGYRYYYFAPVPWDCVFSPYYCYWSVPGYFSCFRIWYGRPRVFIILLGDLVWGYCGRGLLYANYYGYERYGRYDSYSALDRALSDLVDAFRYSDAQLLDRFLPRGETVEIFIDGQYAYSMKSDDYYDVTADLIYSVNTTNFDIVQVRRTRGGEYAVVARHDYLDVSNARETNWLTFTLERRGSGFVITQAGSSRNRPYL